MWLLGSKGDGTFLFEKSYCFSTVLEEILQFFSGSLSLGNFCSTQRDFRQDLYSFAVQLILQCNYLFSIVCNRHQVTCKQIGYPLTFSNMLSSPNEIPGEFLLAGLSSSMGNGQVFLEEGWSLMFPSYHLLIICHSFQIVLLLLCLWAPNNFYLNDLTSIFLHFLYLILLARTIFHNDFLNKTELASHSCVTPSCPWITDSWNPMTRVSVSSWKCPWLKILLFLFQSDKKQQMRINIPIFYMLLGNLQRKNIKWVN